MKTVQRWLWTPARRLAKTPFLPSPKVILLRSGVCLPLPLTWLRERNLIQLPESFRYMHTMTRKFINMFSPLPFWVRSLLSGCSMDMVGSNSCLVAQTEASGIHPVPCCTAHCRHAPYWPNTANITRMDHTDLILLSDLHSEEACIKANAQTTVIKDNYSPFFP